MDEELDYGRYGRQIALVQIGAVGQRALSRVPVCFTAGPDCDAVSVAPVLDCARMLHERAGGSVAASDAASVDVSIRVPPCEDGLAAAMTVGIAAMAAVEAARRVLGETPVALPVALTERLGGMLPASQRRASR